MSINKPKDLKLKQVQLCIENLQMVLVHFLMCAFLGINNLFWWDWKGIAKAMSLKPQWNGRLIFLAKWASMNLKTLSWNKFNFVLKIFRRSWSTFSCAHFWASIIFFRCNPLKGCISRNGIFTDSVTLSPFQGLMENRKNLLNKVKST